MADSGHTNGADAAVGAIGLPDTAMTDAPVATPTIPTPSATTPTPARTTTPQRNGAVGSVPAVSVPEPAFPTKAPPHGARCRQYLNEKVTSVLLAGMKQVAAEQPEDPLRMLGEYLLAESKQLEGRH